MISRVFKAFAYRDFRIMWFGACTSSVGTLMQTFAQAWLVLQLSKSSFLLGLDSFLGSIPIVLFSLVGGVFADRTERQKLLLGSQFVQMACAFLLASLVRNRRDTRSGTSWCSRLSSARRNPSADRPTRR